MFSFPKAGQCPGRGKQAEGGRTDGNTLFERRGRKARRAFAKLGIHCVEDLLEFYPRDYVDYSKPYPVASAPFDTKCVVRAQVYESMRPCA